MKIYIAILGSFLFLAQIQAQTINFYKGYSNNGYDTGEGITQLADSGYAVTGGSSSFSESANDVFLMRTDSVGLPLWSKYYGGAATDYGKRVKFVAGVGYFIAGVTNSSGAGGFDFMLLKTDVNGNYLWTKTYGGADWERLHDAILLPDNSIIMVGETYSNTAGNQDMYVVKTDLMGDTLWTKKYGGIGSDIAYNIIQWSADTLLIAGTKWDEILGKNVAYIRAINPAGGLITEISLSYPTDAAFRSIIRNGQFLNATGEVQISATERDEISATYSSLFTLNDSHAFPFPGDDYGKLQLAYNISQDVLSIKHTNSATIPAYSGGGLDMVFYKFNPYLYYITSLGNYSDVGNDEPNELIKTSDGGAILVGSRSNSSGGTGVVLVKLGVNDATPSQVTLNSFYSLVELSTIYKNEFVVFPNPFVSDFKISSELTGKTVEYTIYNSFGKLVGNGNLDLSETVDLSFLPSGMYLLELTRDSQKSNHKLMKQ